MSKRTRPFTAGIVGGIGAGKSAVARGVGSNLPVVIIDADRAGHQVLKQPDVCARIRDVFGESVFVHGDVDRRALAARVCGESPQNKQSLRQLEEIVHPGIREILTDQIQQVSPHCKAVLLDAPVLLEAGWTELCDAVVFIDTPFERRKSHVAERGWSETELRLREASQLPLADKRRAADFVVDNSGTLERSVQQLVDYIVQRSGAGESAEVT